MCCLQNIYILLYSMRYFFAQNLRKKLYFMFETVHLPYLFGYVMSRVEMESKRVAHESLLRN